MISNSFIHTNDLCEEFIYESHHILNSIYDEVQKSYILESEMIESSIFSEYSDDLQPYYEEENQNIFERIGQKLLDLGKSFVKMIANIVEKVKTAIGGTNKALKDENLKKAMNENPELANEFLKSVASGGIKYNDVADFNALVDEATKITNDYQSGKIDEKSFSDRMDDSLAKFQKKAVPIKEILGVGTAVVTLIAGIQKLTNKASNNCEAAREASLKMAALEERVVNEAKDKLKANAKNNPTKPNGKPIEIRNMNLVAEKHRMMMVEMGKSASAWGKIGWKIAEKLPNFFGLNKVLSQTELDTHSTVAQDALDRYAQSVKDYKTKTTP